MFRLLVVSLLASPCHSFTAAPPRGFVARRSVHLFSSTTDDDIQSMRAGAIKKELESYGISTRTFLEKKELVEALQTARADGLKPKAEPAAASSSTTSSTSSSSSTASSSTSESPESSDSSSKSRNERLAEEMEKCKARKAGDLKKELEGMGISTKSFFEKSEFVKALAEAIVDGGKSDKKKKKKRRDGEEDYAEYADVEVLTSDDAGPRKKQTQDQPKQQQSPFGGGGGGGMPDMGGMGGIGDMLKNMGGMGGGGGGGMPGGMGGIGDMLKGMGGMGGGGDMMGQAQKMMQNPKVMELMMKAQSNPKMMQAMQECMSNPAAFVKYQNDPEVGAFIKELQNVM
jgi:hypothetical protein